VFVSGVMSIGPLLLAMRSYTQPDNQTAKQFLKVRPVYSLIHLPESCLVQCYDAVLDHSWHIRTSIKCLL
jgi:hypothetical protein